jgi:2'-hydroxyisoflavone reductase
MRLLVLGGTLFLGRHVTEIAHTRGHELTLFNRGVTPYDASNAVEQLHGDRDGGLDVLGDRCWDAVIDTSGYVPRVVAESARRLAPRASIYAFVSTIGAYGSHPNEGIDERTPTASLPPDAGTSEDVAALYSELKAQCEREVQDAFGTRALIVRPGLIVGPHDPTERFTYWVRRLAGSGRVLVPDARRQPVQVIDGRDLAAWLIDLAERGQTGVFNATGPAARLTFGELLELINRSAGDGAELVWIPDDRLAAAGVEPWDELPLWLDLPRNPEYRGFLAVDIGRALDAGLELRPLEDTVADTLAWTRERGAVPVKRQGVPISPPGLDPARERRLLAELGPQGA